MQPSVSIALLTYNQQDYVAEALRSVLAQDAGELQILVSDDHSTDGTVRVIQDVLRGYRGKHEVRLNVNAQNLGIAEHVNRVVEMTAGRLIIGAAGDDVSEPHRAARLRMAWESLGSKAQCLYSAVTEISRLGDARRTAVIRRHDRFSDRRYVCRHGGWVLGATIAWSRELFDRFGPLDPSLHGEDWAIPFRASLADGVVLVDEPLVRYRIGTSTWRSPLIDGSSHSETKVRQAANIRLGSARQALRDVMRLGDTSLESLVRQREQEAAALVELCYGKSLSLRSLLRACKSGVRLRQIAALELDRRLPRPLAMLHALRAKLRAAI